MIQFFLAVLVLAYAPIPLLSIAVHILIENNKWRTSGTKKIIWIISIIVWVILALWLKSNYQEFFIHQFSTSISLFFGLAVLVIAVIIEIVSAQALGRKRILGSSEFKKSKDKLITAGIYKYARHPRYVEHPLLFVGLGLIFGYISMLWFALYLFIAFAIAAYFEEQELIKRYGKEYVNYKKRTPTFFIRGINFS